MSSSATAVNPSKWEMKKLDDLGKLFCGQSPSVKDVNNSGVGTVYVTGPEQWDGSKVHISKWTTEPKRVVPDGCIFITVKGAGVGKTFPGIPCAIGRDVYAFKPNDNVSQKFIYWAIIFSVQDVIQHAVGDIPGISKRHILDHEIFVPPFNEQELVVAEIEKQFSRLDEAVTALKRIQANLKRYKAAVLKAAVEGKLTEKWRKGHPDVETADQLLKCILAERRTKWEAEELAKMKAKGIKPKDDSWRKKYKEPAGTNKANLPELPDGWAWASIDAMAFVTKLAGFEYTKYVRYDPDGDLCVIKAENAGKDGFKRTDFSRVKSETISQLTRSKLFAGDLLMVFVGSVGNVARVPDDLNYFLGPNIAMIRVESPFLTPEYLELFLRSPIGNSITLGFAKAVTQPSLSMGTIRMISVALPTRDEQNHIVDEIDCRLSVTKELEATIEINLKRAERLRQRILLAAFSGDLN